MNGIATLNILYGLFLPVSKDLLIHNEVLANLAMIY